MDNAKDLRRFLEFLQVEKFPGVWGFTVYCTYPSKSISASSFPTTPMDERKAEDELYTAVCARFKAYIEAYLRLSIEKPFGIIIPLEIEFIRLPSASVAETRSHFRAKYGWPTQYETGRERTNESDDLRHSYFVIIDQETIETIFEAPDPLQTLPEGEDRSYWQSTEKEDVVVVTIVEADYNYTCGGIVVSTKVRNPVPGSDDCTTFYGCLKTTPRYLQKIWYNLIDMSLMELFPRKDKVYKGRY